MMTATPLIKYQILVAFPSPSAARDDGAAVGDPIFADIFAMADSLNLRGSDGQFDAPPGLPLAPATGTERTVRDEPVMSEFALFAEMMYQDKAALFTPEAGDPSDISKAVDVAVIGMPEANLSVLNMVGDPDTADVPVDLDKALAYLERLLKGNASEADAALSDVPSEGAPQASGAVLALNAMHEADVPVGSGINAFAASDLELALMQLDERLAIMIAGALGPISDEIAIYANTIGLEESPPRQTRGQTGPLVGAEGAAPAQASASPAITATMAAISPERHPLAVLGQEGTTAFRAPSLSAKPPVPVASSVLRAMTSQKITTPAAEAVANSTLKPGTVPVAAVSGDPMIRMAGLAPGAEVPGDALREGGTFQPASLDAGTKQGTVSASLSGPSAGPADRGSVQTALVVPTADRDLMYLDIAKPNVVSAAPLVIAANMKTGRMRSLEQAGGQLFEQRSGLVPQPSPGSEILGAPTADQARAAVARIGRGDAPANAVTDLKPATAPDHRATGQAASDMAGPPVAQSSTQTPTGSSGAASAAPMAQSSGLQPTLDVRRQGWTQTLVQRAAGMVQSGGVLTLKILPQHLGQITLKMSEGRRGLDLRIVTEVASTAAMLRGVESQISSAFEGAGLLLGEFSANSGKGGGTAFGDDGDDDDPALAGMTDADETDAGMISDDTAQHSLLNIIL